MIETLHDKAHMVFEISSMDRQTDRPKLIPLIPFTFTKVVKKE